MFRKLLKDLCITITVLFVYTTLAGAEDLAPIKLPAPRMTGGRPFMEVLKDRKTTRNFAETKLSEQTLSNLLWAACGINRPERNLRTAPSATNQQEIDVYVALEKGLFLYEPKSHELKPVLIKDIRGATGTQTFVKTAPLNLVYVADFGRMRYPNDQVKEFYSAADTGHISQNVYLFCASEGLGAVIRGLVNKESLSKDMNLRPDQKIILSQSIGYPTDATQK
jgi:SagB-type dehydrogenase family enzyme